MSYDPGTEFLLQDGTRTLTGTLSMGGNELTNLATPSLPSSATPRSYVDSAVSGVSAFNALTSGTNTTAAMVVGTGGSLNFTGTGTINASSLQTNFKITGPTAVRTYTFPDATTTVLTTNAVVTVGQGGTGLGTLTAHAVQVGNGTGNVTQIAVPGDGTLFQGKSGLDPSWTATPTLGVAGSVVGTLTFSNATSGTITLQPVVGALGSVTLTLPATSGTIALTGSGGFPVSSTASGAPVILTSSSSTITGTNNSIIGPSAAATLINGTGNVVIGSSTDTGGSGTNNCVAIGILAVAPSNGVAIGNSAGHAGCTANHFVAIGTSAGTAIVGGGENTFVGASAGAACSSGSDNTFIGYTAGSSCGSTTQNTYVGSNCGNNNSAGAHNTFMGYAAGNAANSSDDTFLGHGAAQNYSKSGGSGANVAVGHLSAQSLSTGTNNVIIGDSANVGAGSASNMVAIGNAAVAPTGGTVIGNAAGKASATATNFTCIGNGAGTGITSGTNNTFLGAAAGTIVDTGTGNIAIGASATLGVAGNSDGIAIGRAAVAPSSGVVIGAGAGKAAATGSQFVAIGAGAGAAISTGNQNTLIGYHAGATITTGQQNVIVGASSDTNATGTNNGIFIGYSVTGASSSILMRTGGISSSTTNDFVIEAGDVGLRRVAPKVMMASDGAGALGWFQRKGVVRAGADTSFTSTTTFGTLNSMSIDLAAASVYVFTIRLSFACNSTGQAKIQLNAAAGLVPLGFRANILAWNTSGSFSAAQSQTAMNTSLDVGGSSTTQGMVEITGTIYTDSGGTFEVQGAQTVSNGTPTVFQQYGCFMEFINVS